MTAGSTRRGWCSWPVAVALALGVAGLYLARATGALPWWLTLLTDVALPLAAFAVLFTGRTCRPGGCRYY